MLRRSGDRAAAVRRRWLRSDERGGTSGTGRPWPLASLGRAGPYATTGFVLWVLAVDGAGRGGSVSFRVAGLPTLLQEKLALRGYHQAVDDRGRRELGGAAPIRLVRSQRTLWRTLPNTLILLPPGATEPVTVNGPGPLLWDLLTEPTSLDAICEVLGETYGLTGEAVAEDLEPVVEQLIRMGAVDQLE